MFIKLRSILTSANKEIFSYMKIVLDTQVSITPTRLECLLSFTSLFCTRCLLTPLHQLQSMRLRRSWPLPRTPTWAMSWPRKPTLKWHPCRQSQSKVASKEIVFNKFWLQCLLMENKTCGVLGTGLNSNLSLFSKFSCKGLIGRKAAAKVSGLVEKVTSASVKLYLTEISVLINLCFGCI